VIELRVHIEPLDRAELPCRDKFVESLSGESLTYKELCELNNRIDRDSDPAELERF
jgi:hypothetical protein